MGGPTEDQESETDAGCAICMQQIQWTGEEIATNDQSAKSRLCAQAGTTSRCT